MRPSAITKTSRILSVYTCFRCCEEVTVEEITSQFGVSRKTAYRDLLLLRRAGVLRVRFDKKRGTFIPVSLKPFPMAEEENQTRRRVLERLRRLCLLIDALHNHPDPCVSPAAWYRELFPGVSDRTRQRDFKALEPLGHSHYSSKMWWDEPTKYIYEVPDAYGLETIQK